MKSLLQPMDVTTKSNRKPLQKVGLALLIGGLSLSAQNCGTPGSVSTPPGNKDYTWQSANPATNLANAVHTGSETSIYKEGTEFMDTNPLYVCRVRGFSGISGKVAPSGKCHMPTRYGVDISRREVVSDKATITVSEFTQFEVLLPASGQELKWARKEDYPKQEDGQYSDVLVRVDDNVNSPLICSAYYEDERDDGVLRSGMHPGFVDERIGKCIFPWSGGIGNLEEYQVLVVNN